MLLDTIRSLFGSRNANTPPTPSAPGSRDIPAAMSAGAHDPVAIAACVLLLEIAHADHEFTAAEEAHLASALERHFGLPTESARALMAEAERERQRTVDHFSFTHQLKREFDYPRRVALAETMWGLVLADGEVDEHEHYLTRKISNLLDLAPADLSAAKAAAAQRATG